MKRNPRAKGFQWELGGVYIVKAHGLYKIGSSAHSHRRIRQLRTASPFLEEVHTIICLKWREIEKYLHLIFFMKRVRGEWFELVEADLDWIAAYDWELFPVEHRARIKKMEQYEEWKAKRAANPSPMEKILAQIRSESLTRGCDQCNHTGLNSVAETLD